MMMNHLSKRLLEKVSRLDDFTNSNGKLIFLTKEMVSTPDPANINEFTKFLAILNKQYNTDSKAKDIFNPTYESLLQFCGFLKLKEITIKNQESQSESIQSETSEDLMLKLNSLIGLNNVKSTVSDLIAYYKVQKIRKKAGLKIPNKTMHIAFMGNPGTGKTTVARIIGKLYQQIGLLSKGHFTEVSRTDLIAGYQGQTALKVKNVIEKAIGGVLFIDEAYSLTENDKSDSYGRECLTELTKGLEDYRNDLVVIVAGYTEPMKSFFESNPGLKSRFNTFIEFEDYSSEELIQIYKKMCKEDDYILMKSAEDFLISLMKREQSTCPENFANGRYVRNLYEKSVLNHAKRIAEIPKPTKDDLCVLHDEDVKLLSKLNNGESSPLK